MIEVTNLTRRFGQTIAVDGLSFKVQPGEVLGFLGPNGAGKSTTMKMLTGYLRPSSGSARVYGYDIQNQPLEVQRSLGYLPEGAPLYVDMTVAEFLAFTSAVRGYKGGESLKRIKTVVDLVHLGPVLNKTIETLSKGFKRRVGLAQAILHDPKVLILDEPTDGLDPNQKYEVRQLISSMARDKVIILSTHILEEVDAVCTRAIVISNGRLLADETPQSLLARSKTYGAIVLELDDKEIDVKVLNGISGIAKLEVLATTSGQSFRIYPNKGQNVLLDINKSICHNNWKLRSLTVERGYLDEVFRTLTTRTAA
ncbi:ABC transporter ATP-binding protein [Achromatium sp. WMS2]|nr:ABC transporter ATP-binding protein [Achromatium sp. WMS2]